MGWRMSTTSPSYYNIAWYEQKAVIVLLALLSFGIKNIHLGSHTAGFSQSQCDQGSSSKSSRLPASVPSRKTWIYFSKSVPNKKRSPDFALKKGTALYSPGTVKRRSFFLLLFLLSCRALFSFATACSFSFRSDLFIDQKNQTRSRSQAVPAQRAAARPPAASSSNRGVIAKSARISFADERLQSARTGTPLEKPEPGVFHIPHRVLIGLFVEHLLESKQMPRPRHRIDHPAAAAQYPPKTPAGPSAQRH